MKNGEDGERPVNLEQGAAEAIQAYIDHNRIEGRDEHGRKPITRTQDLIEDILIRDYEEPGDVSHMPGAPIGLRLEYPGEEMGNGIKGLSNRQIWSGLPQQVALPQQIERDLYDDIVSKCSEYNDYLESQSS